MSELVFIRARNVQLFDRGLYVLKATTLFFLKEPPLLLVLSLHLLLITLYLVSVHLIDPEFDKFKFPFFGVLS